MRYEARGLNLSESNEITSKQVLIVVNSRSRSVVEIPSRTNLGVSRSLDELKREGQEVMKFVP